MESLTQNFKFKSVLWLGFLSFLLYFSGFLIWLTPLTILYAYKKRGRSLGLATVGLAVVGLFLFYRFVIPAVASKYGEQRAVEFLFLIPGLGSGKGMLGGSTWFGILYYLFYAGIGLMLGEWEERARSMTLLTARTLVYLMAAVLLWVLWQTRGNFGPLIEGMDHYFLNLLDQMAAASRKGTEASQQVMLLETYKGTIAYYATRLIPGMVVCTAIFVIWLNVLVSRKLFYRETLFPNMESLRRWHLPFFYVWILIGVSGLLLLDIYVFQNNVLKIIALNIFLVFGLVYFFQGLAILAFYSQRWSVSPFVKIIFYLLFLLFFQPVGILLLAFGFFDSWFDFRKLSSEAARP